MDSDSEGRISSRWIIAAIVVSIPVVIVLGFGLYLAGQAGELPWQEDPTRIPVTPFANLPTPSSASGTPVPGS